MATNCEAHPTVGILDFAANAQDFSISTVGDEQDMEGATDPSNGMSFGSQRKKCRLGVCALVSNVYPIMVSNG